MVLILVNTLRGALRAAITGGSGPQTPGGGYTQVNLSVTGVLGAGAPKLDSDSIFGKASPEGLHFHMNDGAP